MKNNKIFQFSIPENYADKKIADYKWRERKTDQYLFMGCQFLKTEESYDLKLEVECSLEKIIPFDVLPNNFDSPIVKRRALEILQDLCPKAFQVFEVEIQAEDGVSHDYKILNLLQEIDHVNYEKSDTLYFDRGGLMGFEHLVMKPHAMEDHHIGRLKDMHTIIVVSETLQKAFKKAKIKGVAFRELESG